MSRARKHTHTYTHAHTLTHAYAHIHTHTHTHMHLHMRVTHPLTHTHIHTVRSPCYICMQNATLMQDLATSQRIVISLPIGGLPEWEWLVYSRRE